MNERPGEFDPHKVNPWWWYEAEAANERREKTRREKLRHDGIQPGLQRVRPSGPYSKPEERGPAYYYPRRTYYPVPNGWIGCRPEEWDGQGFQGET